MPFNIITVLNNGFLFLNVKYFKMQFIPVIIAPVFSVTWSSRNPSYTFLGAQETFIININDENSCTA